MIYRFKPYKRSSILEGHIKLGNDSFKVNSLYIERDRRPWIGVMGEYHFCRDKRENWHRELCKMKAGGIGVVSTYLFWIYHEEEEGVFDFSGDLDVRAFILECQSVGLDVIIRIGPWAHGECRNGGFPDWLLKKPFELRSENAGFMAKTEIWFRRIYDEVKGLLAENGGNVIGIQLENEMCDSPDYLLSLKRLAQRVGLTAPLYTVTGWNSAAGAKIPLDEVIPVFGGYVELPWEAHTDKLPPSMHYFFTPHRNDSSIGKDLSPIIVTWTDWQLPYERYPFATCELGGGIQNTHHRRAIINGKDIYAMSLVKLGCGNNLVGYYMYHGGTNKIGKLSTLQESKATGYPNDYPILSYDFQAPLSEYGEAREQYRLLNMLHMFINDFGDILAPMEYVASENEVSDINDNSSLRYSLRTDGSSGFIFVNHYQRGYPMSDVDDVVFEYGGIRFPSINVKGDVSFILPFNISLHGEVLSCATAQLLCEAEGVYFFAAVEGITPTFCFADGFCAVKEAGLISHGGVDIFVLSPAHALYARKLSGKMYVGVGCDVFESGTSICSIAGGKCDYLRFDATECKKMSTGKAFVSATLTEEDVSEPFAVPYAEELSIGGERKRTWKKLSVDSPYGFVEIGCECDAAQLYANKKLVADEFYYGVPWRVPAELLYGKECYLVMSEVKNDFYKEY